MAPSILFYSVIPARSSASDLRRYSRRKGTDLRRSTSRSSMRYWTAPAHSTKGALTQSASANSSRGHSARPRTQSGDRSSSCLYNNNRHDNRRGRQDNDRRDDRRRDSHQPEDRRDERDPPPLPETGNPNGPFQQAKRSINMIVGA
jgi:hypothetical protein